MNQPKKTTKKRVKKTSVPAVIENKNDITIDVDPQALITVAIQNNAPIEMMERLLDMRERLRAEQAETEFRKAMSAFQAECPVIPKKKEVRNSKEKGGGLRYKYAPLDTIIQAVQPYIAKNNLSYDIDTEITRDPIGITARVDVYHVMGHHKTTTFWVPIDNEAYMTDQQKFGSMQTFAKRYAFQNAFGILTGDGDNDANNQPPKSNPKIEKAKAEAIKKLDALPDEIKQGFGILGYTQKAGFIFCEKFGWDNPRIKSEINKILDSKNVDKI